MRDRSDWMLNQLFLYLEVNLFAARLTSQLPCFFSWRPDPLAEGMDAFLQDWSLIKGYANHLVGKELSKLGEQVAGLSGTGMAITTVISQTAGTTGYQPSDHRSSGGSNSGNCGSNAGANSAPGCVAYLRQHYTSQRLSGEARPHVVIVESGDRSPHNLITHCVKNGSAGVLNGKLIQFRYL